MAAETQAGADGAQTENATLLDQIVNEGHMAHDDSQREHAKDLVGEFVHQVVDESMQLGADTVQSIKDRIAEIDAKISAQLNEIMHADEFKELEASWRGLDHLVMKTETGEKLKLRLLNLTKGELLKDLTTASDHDQSQLFKKVYEEEYGTFGGFPYSVLVTDFELGRHPQDIELLRRLAAVAAAAHAPLIAPASSKLFDMQDFGELGKPRDLSKIFESSEMIGWRSFRESEDSRYVSLALPHVLLRLPYGADTLPIEEFDFAEDVDGRDPSRYLWGAASWFLAERVTSAFARYGWTAAIRGYEGGGAVESLPIHTFTSDDGDLTFTCPTEVSITDRRENELNKLGFIALVHRKGTDKAAFFGGQTTQKPKVYDLDEATANASLSARLPYILAASRFAHYLKVICRDKVGSFLTADDVSRFLNRWINQYVLARDDAGQDLKAESPLREARVDVTANLDNPGSYNATVFLRPHFQLEELTTSIRLVAELPPPAA
ncbi:MAG: type VI secretion system contractile sheath large subunit [Acidobacteriota bacterium]